MDKITLQPHNKTEKKKSWDLIKRMAGNYLRPYAGRLLVAMIFMAVSAGLTGAFAVMIEPVMDDVLGAGKLDKVWSLGFVVFLIFFFRGITTYAHTVMMNQIGQRIVADIQKAVFSHFMTLDLKFFHANPSGQLLSRVVNDVNVMRTAVVESLTGFGKSLLTLFSLVGVMFYQDWVLACSAFVIFPFAAGFVVWIGQRLRKFSGRIQDDMADLSDILSQIFQGVRLVKAYGMEEYEKERAEKSIFRVRDLIMKSVQVGNLSTPVNEFLIGVVIFGIVVYGGYEVAAGRSSAGELLSFITAFTMSYEPMKKLARLNNKLQTGLGAADRVFDLMDTVPDVEEAPGAVSVSLSRPEITFENVEFQYEDDEKKALEGVSFTLAGGQVSALVGRSGSGKTTIMNSYSPLFRCDRRTGAD